MKKFLLIFLVLGMLLTACGGENLPDEGAPPLPDDAAPDEPIVNLPGETPFEDREPAPGQAEWSRGEAFVNDAQILVMESFPIQVALEIQGDLPTPCNKLTVDISEPDADNVINIEVYSLINPAETCIQVIEPFFESVSLPTENLPDGTYSVRVNGTMVGGFTYPGG